MSYNTLDKPYIYVNMDADGSNTFANRLAYMQRLKELFELAGWEIQDVPYRFTIFTEFTGPFVPTRTFCTLWNLGPPPPSDYLLFAVNFSDSALNQYVIDVDISCFIDGSFWDDEDEIKADTVALLNYSNSWTTIRCLEGNHAPSNWIANQSDDIFPNIDTTHERIWNVFTKYMQARSGPTEYYGTISAGNRRTSHFAVYSDDALEYTASFGGFLESGSSEFLGKGFIATSPANGDDDNFHQIYVHTNPSGTGINFSAISGDDVDFREPGEYLHPYGMVENLDGVTITPVTWLLNTQPLHGFIGPHFFIFEQNSTRRMFGGVLNIKELEVGSSGEITRARVFDSWAAAGVQWEEIKLNGVNYLSTGNSSTPLPINRYKSHTVISPQASTNENIIEWPGAVAQMFESWCGFYPFPGHKVTSLFATIPGAIIPGRNANPTRTYTEHKADLPFVFDEHLFRYWEGRLQPIAFWIKEPRYYDADGFDNKVPMYKVLSASLSPANFAPGGTCTLTITIDLDEQPYTNLGGYVLVYTDNERIAVLGSYSGHSGYVYFEPGAETAEVDLVENNLGTGESLTIKIFHDSGQSIYNLVVTAN